MTAAKLRIGVVAPASRLDPATAEEVLRLAQTQYAESLSLEFHPQCFLSAGHFAGEDAERSSAFLDIANDSAFDVLWFGRGGYGSGRIAEIVLPQLNAAARKKIYLGYSDAGALMGAMYAKRIGRLAHGPMPADFLRKDGRKAISRALDFLSGRDGTLEPSLAGDAPTAAFNVTILGHLLGTPFEPDLSGHILMLEEVAEYMYRIDRTLLQITSNPMIRRVAGLRLGRCSAIPPNEPDFGQSEEQVARHWCAVSGIAYLGRADIGHDVDNKIVPFGTWRI